MKKDPAQFDELSESDQKLLENWGILIVILAIAVIAMFVSILRHDIFGPGYVVYTKRTHIPFTVSLRDEPWLYWANLLGNPEGLALVGLLVCAILIVLAAAVKWLPYLISHPRKSKRQDSDTLQ